MAQRDLSKRYLDAGMAFTAMTKARAEGMVRELIKAGEVQRDQFQNQVDGLFERSRRNGDHLVTVVREKVSSQINDLASALRDEFRHLAGSGGEAGAASEQEATVTETSVATKTLTTGPESATTSDTDPSDTGDVAS